MLKGCLPITESSPGSNPGDDINVTLEEHFIWPWWGGGGWGWPNGQRARLLLQQLKNSDTLFDKNENKRLKMLGIACFVLKKPKS